MRLEVTEHHDQHTDLVACATWSPAYELYTCGDDNKIVRWRVDGEVVGETSTGDAFVTCISWMPSVGKAASETFAMSCTDGTIRLMAGAKCREEKKVQAHHGAALKVVWNLEGSALYSAGEDGELKVWSKSGNLRSTPVKTGHAIYAVAVGPTGEELCYVNEKKLCIEGVGERKSTPQSWVAHEATILCVSWNAVSNRIVSGGEDCRYKVWDHFGRQLFQSQPYAQVITSVAWSPNGEFFAVGAFHMLRLCDKTGWSCSRDSPKCGSVMHLAWTRDGTQLVGAGGNGGVVIAQLVDRRLEWEHVEATLVTPKLINVHDVVAETYESLDFNRDRVVEMALGYGHLVVSTTTQCFIYQTHNWNTPYIFDSTEGTVSMIVLAEKHFAVLTPTALTLYAYDGRKLSQPRFPGLRPEVTSQDCVSLAPDMIAIVDSTDRKLARLFDVTTGRPISHGLSVVTHKAEIVHVALNQHANQTDQRQLVLIDKNQELYIFQLTGGDSKTLNNNNNAHDDKNRAKNQSAPGLKLQTQVDTVKWNSKAETLCAVADGRLLVWSYPQIAYTDRDLLPMTVTTKDASDLGKLSEIVAFDASRIAVRRADGALVTTVIAPYAPMLYDFASSARWDEATRLCRFVEDDACWAMLAAMAVEARNLDVAELSLAALKEIDKLEYILHIKKVPSQEAKMAELALYKRCPDLAERILLQASPPLLYRAIKLNINLFKWDRALELAIKHRSHVDTVLAYRAAYLDRYKKKETDDRFNQLNATVKWDWETIKAKKELEKQEEADRAGVKYVPKKKKAANTSGPPGSQSQPAAYAAHQAAPTRPQDEAKTDAGLDEDVVDDEPDEGKDDHK